jgi:hypothetical protein
LRFVFLWVVSRMRNIWTPLSAARSSCCLVYVCCSYQLYYMMSLPSNIRIAYCLRGSLKLTKSSQCMWSQRSFYNTV